jgi:formylglycine-generating enzyme required for sulfatase activity
MENSDYNVHPPQKLRPGRRGLFDLHGNLDEWTHDWYGDYDTKPSADPLGPNEGSHRLHRGGAHYLFAALCRTGIRNKADPSRRSPFVGFRLALSPSGGAPEAGKSK